MRLKQEFAEFTPRHVAAVIRKRPKNPEIGLKAARTAFSTLASNSTYYLIFGESVLKDMAINRNDQSKVDPERIIREMLELLEDPDSNSNGWDAVRAKYFLQ